MKFQLSFAEDKNEIRFISKAEKLPILFLRAERSFSFSNK
jgi:hypothetical protein